LIELSRTTMLGALCYYVSHADPKSFQPMKANFGILPPLENPPRDKRARAALYAERALSDLRSSISDFGFTLSDPVNSNSSNSLGSVAQSIANPKSAI
jgi:methylenetetrahydrofolate--tRNA-(uracil-5-)-methyltransferase